MTTLVCVECGRSFLAKPYEARKGRQTCSPACRCAYYSKTYRGENNHKHQLARTERTCVRCGALFHRPRWVTESEAARFCSRPCYHATLHGAGNPNFIDGRTCVDPLMYKRDATRLRRERERGAPGQEFAPDEWAALKARHGNRCLACGKSGAEVPLVPDHVVPIARGGSLGIQNVQPLCQPCNGRKWAYATDYRSAHINTKDIDIVRST